MCENEIGSSAHRDENAVPTGTYDIYRKADRKELGIAKKENGGFSFTPNGSFTQIGSLFDERMKGLRTQICRRLKSH